MISFDELHDILIPNIIQRIEQHQGLARARRKVTLVALLCFAASFTAICSGSWVHLDPLELYGMADTIVEGAVIDVRSTNNTGFSYIYAEIRVTKYLKNPQEPPTVAIIASKVKPRSGVTDSSIQPLVEFKEGEKVVVYLERSSNGYYSLVGGFQGKFTFTDGKYVNPSGEIMYAPRPLSTVVFGLTVVGAIALVIVYWRKR